MASTPSCLMSIRTRIATESDLAAIAELFDSYRQFYEQAPDAQVAQRFIAERLRNHDSILLVAEEGDGDAVGFCQLYPSFCSIEAKPIYILSDLFVRPNARRSGAGTALLKAAEKYSSQNGRVKMELTTAKTNKVAQAAYQSLGWQQDEVFLAYGKRVEAALKKRAPTG